EIACHPLGFRSAMGEILPDRDLFSSLSASCPFPIDQETRGFQGEHSIEFVVIWLQALRDLFFPGRSFTILPILCGGFQSSIETGTPPSSSSAETAFARGLARISQESDTAVRWTLTESGATQCQCQRSTNNENSTNRTSALVSAD
ncbi:MAG: hypothetical protein EBZ75_12935, partial [Oxalobacteraceae bacterium]|nr:hypothetical protein [Oxalobacteraceae bacterium]